MNRRAEKLILITGNGFDLALGLPTSYNDFIEVVRGVRSHNDGAIDVQAVLPEKFKTLNEHYRLEKIYSLKEITEPQYANNLWLKYFLTASNTDPDKKWVDFERDIRQILDDVAHLQIEINSIEKETKGPHGAIYNGIRNRRKDSVHLNENSFGRLKRLLNWSSTATEVIDLRRQTEQSPKAILHRLSEELKVFSEIFKIYLENFVMKIFKSRKFEKIEINADRVITFNYTHSVREFGIPCNYLHGDLKGNLIFGIDNANDLTETLGPDALSFTKYFQTIFHKTYASEFKLSIKKKPAPQTHYFFYGHSFDLSDKSYIAPIFTEVLKNETQKITIGYDKDERRAPILRSLLDRHMLGDNANDIIEELVANGKLNFEHIKSIIPTSYQSA